MNLGYNYFSTTITDLTQTRDAFGTLRSQQSFFKYDLSSRYNIISLSLSLLFLVCLVLTCTTYINDHRSASHPSSAISIVQPCPERAITCPMPKSIPTFPDRLASLCSALTAEQFFLLNGTSDLGMLACPKTGIISDARPCCWGYDVPMGCTEGALCSGANRK